MLRFAPCVVREFDAPVSTDILLGWTVLDRRVWPVRMEGGFGDFFFFFTQSGLIRSR